MTTNINANPLATGTDEIERFALEECIKRQRVDRQVSVMIYPAGRCELAAQFARMGAQVTIVDDASRQQEIEGRLLSAGLRDEIRFCAATPQDLPEDIPGQAFDIIIVRRGLCKFHYDEARRIVRQLLLKLKIGGKLYLSILGMHSELGDGYLAGDLPVENRYAELSPAMVSKYDIKGPVCLYTERNLFMLLLEAGGSVLRTLTTTYGNVKGVAVRV